MIRIKENTIPKIVLNIIKIYLKTQILKTNYITKLFNRDIHNIVISHTTKNK